MKKKLLLFRTGADVIVERLMNKKWRRHFYLYDKSQKQYQILQKLKEQQPERDSKDRKINRQVDVFQGDFNELISELLDSNAIKPKDATFCLLDQRTFECKWSTVEKLAKYKEEGNNKIGLFYFLPNSWQDRALSGLTINKT